MNVRERADLWKKQILDLTESVGLARPLTVPDGRKIVVVLPEKEHVIISNDREVYIEECFLIDKTAPVWRIFLLDDVRELKVS